MAPLHGDREARGASRPSGEAWPASGHLWDVRLLSLLIRRFRAEAEDVLALDAYPDPCVEQRGGRGTSLPEVDDLDGDALLWSLGVLAYRSITSGCRFTASSIISNRRRRGPSLPPDPPPPAGDLYRKQLTQRRTVKPWVHTST